MIRQLERATARIEEANAALDELIFALHRRLQACRAQRAKAKKLDEQRRRPAPVGAPPNLWWVGGVIPLDLFFPGSDPHQVEEGFG